MNSNMNSNTNTNTNSDRMTEENTDRVNHVQGVEKYNEFKSNDGLVVVDFSAEWCGPCKLIAPYYSELSRKYTNVTFLHVDIEGGLLKNGHEDLADVRGVPTFKFFVNGECKDQFSGASKDKLIQFLDKYQNF